MSAGSTQRTSRPGPPAGVVRPTRDDSFARWASELIGGPAGCRLADPAHRWWWAAPVLVAVGAAMLAAGVLRYQHCRINGWSTPGQFVHTCYSDVAVLFSSAGGTPAGVLGLDGGAGTGQPAVTALLMAAIALLLPVAVRLDQALLRGDATATEAVGLVDAGPRLYFDLTVVVLAVAVVVLVLAVVGLSGRRLWDAGLVAWSPVVALAGLVSIDLLAVAFAAAGCWAWVRERPWLAGALLGLAVGARPHLVLVLLALLIVSTRLGSWGPVSRLLSAAAVSWSIPNLVMLLAAPNAWLQPLRQWWFADPAVAYGSLGFVLDTVLDAVGVSLPTQAGPALSLLSLLASGVVVVAVTWWVLRARQVPRLPVVVLVLLVGVLLVGKTVPVQASLALLPWAALAVPRYRHHLWWWAAEAAYVVAVWQHLVIQSNENRALPAGYYAAFILFRLGAMAWLAGLALWATARPATDPVRLAHLGSDPAAGPLLTTSPVRPPPGGLPPAASWGDNPVVSNPGNGVPARGR